MGGEHPAEPHYSSRLPRDLPRVDGEIPAGFGKPRPAYTPGSQWMRRRLEAHVFRDCADERILSTFVYAARDGISFFGKNRASLVIHGTDTGDAAWRSRRRRARS